MKNMRMKMKLLVSFTIVVCLSILVGLAGIIGLSELSSKASLIDTVHENSLMVQKLQTNLETQRSLYRDAVLRVSIEDTTTMEEKIQTIEVLDAEAKAMLLLFRTSFTQQETIALLDDVDQSYANFADTRDTLLAGLRSHGNVDRLIPKMEETARHAEVLNGYTSQLTSFASAVTDDMVNSAAKSAVALTAFMLLTLLFCVGLSIGLALYISALISNPTAKLVTAANKLAVGDIHVELDIDSEDEIGQLAQAFRNMADEVQHQANILSLVAEGDYSQEIPIRSAEDCMNSAINGMIARSNSLIEKISQSSEEIDNGTAQVAKASQSLAVGAGEQATTLEEFNQQVASITGKAEENSAIASVALQNSEQSKALMQESVEAMSRMIDAMSSISESGRDISRIIKIIDDIAFQTNILSLNAAVEAARAGAQGKGFAVVADEVRNLAAKSARAAKDTEELISSSVQQVHIGQEIVTQVDRCLQNIQEYAQKNMELLQEIDLASHQQSQSLTECSVGIQQITSVVQSNSAIAEETAAASQQMAAQSASLQQLLSVYRTRKSQKNKEAHTMPPFPVQTGIALAKSAAH